MADLQDRGFETVLGGDTFFYPAPNPALTQILVGDRLGAVVGDYTLRVAINYIQRLADRPHIGDDHVGRLASTVNTDMFIGGFKNDRHVGEVTVGGGDAPYGAADQYGRNAYAQYEGLHDLTDALYAELRPL